MAGLPERENIREYFAPRSRVAALLVVAALGLLVVRLWQLQMIQGESYLEMSRENRMRLIRLPPSRGRILGSQGEVLADNRPAFALSVVRGELRDPPKVVATCADILGMPPETLRHVIQKSKSVPRFLTYPIKKNMSLEEVSLASSSITDLKGVVLEVKPRRSHPFGSLLCHVLGTLGEISPRELAGNARMGYRAGDLVGKSGIEKQYEAYLKGEEGWKQIEINAKGKQLGSLGVRSPVQGADVVLTLDIGLQKFVEKMFIHRAGSVIVIDPETGRVLAMVSKPGFDLNLFSPSISRREWKELSTDPLHPLENRSIRGLYAPASTFKIVTAAAALAEKVVKPRDQFTCKGELKLGGQTFRCWNRYGHGKVDLRRAIVESCDIYFYELGLRLGAARIARYASLFGFGKPTGLKLPQELPGLIPTSLWKQRTFGESWKDGETLNLAIGQGYLVSTPIQLAMMTAAFANGGRLLRPAIVKQIRGPEGRIVFDHVPVTLGHIPLSAKDLAFLRAAMIGVVADEHGTGRRSRVPGIRVAGKTGTSQVIRHRYGTEELGQVPYHERAHALFVGFVDEMPRKIAVVVVVEHGGGGGEVAAPIARKIICRYYGIPDPGDPEPRRGDRSRGRKHAAIGARGLFQ
jgi:penicillin-binding protein 2